MRKTAEQCRKKAKKQKAEYRKVKDSQNKSGAGRKSWKYLDAMDAVLVLVYTASKEVSASESDEKK